MNMEQACSRGAGQYKPHQPMNMDQRGWSVQATPTYEYGAGVQQRGWSVQATPTYEYGAGVQQRGWSIQATTTYEYGTVRTSHTYL